MIAECMKKYWYDGNLSSKKRSGIIKQAYSSYSDQCSRCRNPRNVQYKMYGARGISVEYSCREFIGWWIENLSRKNWTKPTAGRIDHNKGYSFDNIEMQEASENSKEQCKRNKEKMEYFKTIRKFTLVLKNGVPYGTFFSRVYAGESVGLSADMVKYFLKKGRPSKDGIKFIDLSRKRISNDKSRAKNVDEDMG